MPELEEDKGTAIIIVLVGVITLMLLLFGYEITISFVRVVTE